MTLRRLAAIAIFGIAAYYGLYGVRILLEGADAYAKLVAIVYCGCGVVGTLIAVALGFGRSRTRASSHEEADSAVARFKSFPVLLIAVVFGLGCLYFAAQGLLTGSIATLTRRGSSALSFSTHPLPFLALLTVWGGLGTCLLWVSWRAFRRDRPQ